jgi:folylpolyglutamate synthase/dihydropteroate synthase
VSVGLAGEHQVLNASLAVALVRSWEQRAVLQPPSTTSSSSSHPTAETTAASERLQQLQSGVLPLQYCEGLQKAAWPGRSQVGGRHCG